MVSNLIYRVFHTNSLLWQASSKSLLAKLRKKTGYTFANCKKALELHQNDLDKAEVWLKEQAQQHGWMQAERLQDRNTSQGLIALIVDKNHGSLIELNCETDFVARNKKFHALAETVATAVLKHTTTLKNDSHINKTVLYKETLQNLPAADGTLLKDHSALAIGSVGENISLRRALCMSVQPGIILSGCTHPAPMNPIPVSFGKYGALIALQCKKKDTALGTQLCQHIIGMNPKKIGDPKVDVPHDDIDEEPCMIFQEYLLDPSLSVQQVLIDAEAEILDFTRFEMGEILENEQSLDSVETCG